MNVFQQEGGLPLWQACLYLAAGFTVIKAPSAKKVPITLLVVNLINAIHLSIFGSLFDLDVHD
ncbi:hypothetical protein [Paenibacillus validus]|uniref:hypothetical protein n=1 Tax=Paenibacillus validus TaxID=44253 RepID=UPI003D2D041E